MLKIDLLPEHFAAARAAKAVLLLMIVLLLATILGCFGVLMLKKRELGRVTQERDKAKAEAAEVDELEKQAKAKEDLAAPIGAKVTFIEDADGCGEQWFAAFDKVNRYIYARARVTSFTIEAPNQVHFVAELPDTTSVGRFILNLVRCPDISGIRIGGSPPAGPAVGPAGGAAAPAGAGAGMAGAMGMGAPGGPPEMGGMGGMPPGGMPGAPGMEGGMAGMGGGPPAAGGSRAGGPIVLTVDATLKEGLATPAPGGGAPAAAGGMPGAGGGMPGMMGGGMPGAPGASGMMAPPGGSGPPGGGAPAPGPPARCPR